jgi:hypothetical protein
MDGQPRNRVRAKPTPPIPIKTENIPCPPHYLSSAPTKKDLIRELDILRAALRLSMSTIRKMKANQPVNTSAVLRKLGAVRADAKAVRDSVVTK